MIEQTLTPQNAFPLVGSLEDESVIQNIALAILTDKKAGLMLACVDGNEGRLCRHLHRVLLAYPDNVNRADIARIKEMALLYWGGPVAVCVDCIASAMRTPAVAESAIRSAGTALFQAADRPAVGKGKEARRLFRKLIAQAIKPMSEAELNI